MSDKKQEDKQPLGAVLGWINLSSTLPNNQDNIDQTISASPTRFIDYNQLIEANRNAQNLQLAHEIVFNKDFQLKLPEYEKGSIGEKVHDTMHTAFWDILKEDLSADPPRYEHIVKLIGEAKEDLKSLVLPHQITLKNQIDESIDLDTLKRRFEAKSADPHEYTKYFIDTMANLCAQCRDENIEKLRTIQDPTECFRNIMEVLSLMKIDMANFNIRQYRPLLQQQAIDYEKTTFKKLMESQREMGIDPLASTYKWLERAYNRLKTNNTIGWYQITTNTNQSESSIIILNEAYCELLLWNPKNSFPETLELDEIRYNQVHISTMRLLIISTIMIVLSHITGSILRDYQSIKNLLKSQIIILLDDFPEKKKLKDVLISISEQVIKTTHDELIKYDKANIIINNEINIKDSIKAIGEHHVIEHAVFKLLFQRYVDFVHNVMDNPSINRSLSNVAIPNGLNIVMDEVISTVSFFLRLITYNKMVFNEHYDRIISELKSSSDE
ncbi:unnamed protein product [Rotaria sp. Silwood1]|nr:unnamed protein product [Rotaria sp. Silwood1]CAF1613586.1 unnamed protein product [Rotaria sp. Silwood1]